MKKVLAALAVLAVVVSSHAQGYVLFQNAGNTRVSTNSIAGGAATGRISANDGTVANSYYFALFTSTGNLTTVSGSSAAVNGLGNYAFNASGWTAATSLATNGAAFGQFQSAGADPANSGQTVLASGAAQTYVIVGWSANIGSTLQSLITWYNNGAPLSPGYIGESVVSGSITPSAGGASPTVAITGTGAGFIPGFTLGLVPTPEPSTMALAALGGLSLLAFRRKK